MNLDYKFVLFFLNLTIYILLIFSNVTFDSLSKINTKIEKNVVVHFKKEKIRLINEKKIPLNCSDQEIFFKVKKIYKTRIKTKTSIISGAFAILYLERFFYPDLYIYMYNLYYFVINLSIILYYIILKICNTINIKGNFFKESLNISEFLIVHSVISVCFLITIIYTEYINSVFKQLLKDIKKSNYKDQYKIWKLLELHHILKLPLLNNEKFKDSFINLKTP